MRNVFSPQMSIGQIGIPDIVIDVSSRDDIPQLLLGLQHIYCTPPLRDTVFKILAEIAPNKQEGESASLVSLDKGRPGMDQWAILVLGSLRLALNGDHDRILELANQHKTLRDMLGHSGFEDGYRYRLQTLKDNLKLFTPALMARINAEVVRAGHTALGLDPRAPLHGRCDSFVVETHVHFPTDINLLYDAIRKLIQGCAQWSASYPLFGWRQHAYHLRQFKKQYRGLQKLKHSTSKDEGKKAAKQHQIEQAYQDYIDLAQGYLDRARISLACLRDDHQVTVAMLAELDIFCQHAARQIDQINRRALQGEAIPHAEKVFSLFQPHTEWISKGKAGVPVELGLRVCILEDQHGFILHSLVMQNTTDDQVAVPMVKVAQAQLPNLKTCSYDKGFHNPNNQQELKKLLDQVVLPKKGKLSKADRERESAPEFKCLRRQHSAVESAINALEVHGLDTCPDHGIDGFERYVGLAVLSRNLQQLGAIKRNQTRQRLLAEKLKQAA
jgi:hypothetical protein